MGLVSAHFDIPQEATIRGDLDYGTITTKLNAGMAVVTPAHFIRRLLDRDDVREHAEEYRAGHELQPAATMDVLGAFDEDFEEAFAEDAPSEERQRFDDFASKLMQVPKSEIDEQRRAKK